MCESSDKICLLYYVFIFLLFSAFYGWRITEDAGEIIKESSDCILSPNIQGSSTYSAWKPIWRKSSTNPVKMHTIMRWMTCMAACDKEHLLFEQAQLRFLGDTFILAYI